MINSERLDKLAKSYGIQPDYVDIWGNRHVISDETKTALLGAMGLACESDSSMQAYLDEKENRDWTRYLPPVMVVRETKFPCEIPVTLPDMGRDGDLSWRLVTELGKEISGRVPLSQLDRREQKQVHDRNYFRCIVRLTESPGLGYHQFEVSALGQTASMRFIVVPDRCYLSPAVSAGRVWGLSVQLYSVRSRRNWGMGDFTDLKSLFGLCGSLGADLLGLNPLHALFAHDARHCSPYDPSNRMSLNLLYIDVEAVPEYSEAVRKKVREPEFQARLRQARASEMVDYPAVSALKMSVLEMLFAEFRKRHSTPATERGRRFQEFQKQSGEALKSYALFEALQEQLYREDESCWGYLSWPEKFRDPRSPAVAAFADSHRERVEFFQYLQWLAQEQLESARDRARELHLGIGVYMDLAISVNRSGSEVWCNQPIYARNVGVGAPPDEFNLKGQNWGLLPMLPDAMRESAYTAFIAIVRQNMKTAGALRLDHVMALMRLFWIPDGLGAAEGAYVWYPFEDLLGIVSLESQRNRCIVIGEDLGTVPDAVRHALRDAGVFSYSLLYFERDHDGSFKKPGNYPAQALTAISTHDLPTLAGYWEGRDLVVRTQLDLFPTHELRARHTLNRTHDRVRLLLALNQEALLPKGMGLDPVAIAKADSAFALAVHTYLARTTSRIAMAQIEDALGQVEQMNLPGTVDQHPNWRRKIAVPLEEMTRFNGLQDIGRAFSRERPKHS